MGVMEILMDQGPAPVPAVSEDEVRSRIVRAHADAQVTVRDLTGNGNHYQVEIISAAFAGVSPVMRHRMVYKLFEDVIGKELHALALSCLTPAK